MSYGEGINGGIGGIIPADYAQRFDLEMVKVRFVCFCIYFVYIYIFKNNNK
jgi:hypothetical protein